MPHSIATEKITLTLTLNLMGSVKKKLRAIVDKGAITTLKNNFYLTNTEIVKLKLSEAWMSMFTKLDEFLWKHVLWVKDAPKKIWARLIEYWLNASIFSEKCSKKTKI